jgi:hypothetical protein
MIKEIVNMSGGGIHTSRVSEDNRCSLRRHSRLETEGERSSEKKGGLKAERGARRGERAN